jgi:preprotein translocase subunit SecG
VLSLFIILIILLQRGRGGGLTGALGGAGGASAFGVKAGDIFTRITAISVLVWIVLCAVTCFWYLPPKLDIESDPGSISSAGSSTGMGALPPLGSEEPIPPGESAAPPASSSTQTTSTPPADQPVIPSDAGKSLPLPNNDPAIPNNDPVVKPGEKPAVSEPAPSEKPQPESSSEKPVPSK